MVKTVKSLKQNNSGMTMVEVLMGFLILSIILGGVVTMITFSANMYFDSVDERREQTVLMENAYKNGASSGASSGASCVISTSSEGGEEIKLDGMTRYEIPENTYIFTYSK